MTLGGIQKQVLRLAVELKKKGYHPIIAGVNKKSNDFVEELIKEGVEYYDFSGWWKRWPWGHRYLKVFNSTRINLNIRQKIKPEVIFSYTHGIAFNINIAWQFSGAKESYFMERSGVERYNTKPNKLERWSVKNSTQLIANSQHASKDLAKYFNLKRNETGTIVNFIDYPAKKLSLESLPNFNMNSKVYLMIANFWSEKNHELLINSWQEFQKDRDVSLILIGQSINNEVQVRFDNQNKIYYAGSLKNASAYIHLADVCILSSFVEGCPNVVLEYLYESKLFIGSDIPAIREIIPAKYHNDLLYDNYSEADCISKLEFALENTNNTEIIKDCKRVVKERYTLDVMVNEYENILKHV